MLARATHVLTSAGLEPIRTDEVLRVSEQMAADGLRLLALATRRWTALPPDMTPGTVERELTVLGLVGIMDPPREEAREAIQTCRRAGIVPIMITGDHPLTARYRPTARDPG